MEHVELYHGVPNLPQQRCPRLEMLAHPPGYISDREIRHMIAYAQSVIVDDNYPCPTEE